MVGDLFILPDASVSESARTLSKCLTTFLFDAHNYFFTCDQTTIMNRINKSVNTQYAKVIKLLNCISLVNHPFIATTLSVQLHDAGTAKYLESFVFTNRGLVASLDLSRVFFCIN